MKWTLFILFFLVCCKPFPKRPQGWNYNKDCLYLSGYYKVEITKFKDQPFKLTIFDGKTQVIAEDSILILNGKEGKMLVK